MRCAARFHTNQTARQLGEKRHHLPALELATQNHRSGGVHAVHLKNPLGQIQPDRRNLPYGWSPLCRSCMPKLGTQMPFRGAIDPIKPGHNGLLYLLSASEHSDVRLFK